MHRHLGIAGVVGFLMKDLSANPLDYAEGGAFNRRGEALRRCSTRRIDGPQRASDARWIAKKLLAG